jgi:hypothetical protein
MRAVIRALESGRRGGEPALRHRHRPGLR